MTRCSCRTPTEHPIPRRCGDHGQDSGLDQALAAVRADDMLVAPKLDRLARWCSERMTMHTTADSCEGSKTRSSAWQDVRGRKLGIQLDVPPGLCWRVFT